MNPFLKLKLKNYYVKLRSKVVEKNMKNNEKIKDNGNITMFFTFVKVDFNLELKSRQIKVTGILYAFATNERRF